MNEIAAPAERAERVVRVIKGNEAKAEIQLKNADTSRSQANIRQAEALNLRAAESDLKSQIKRAEDIQATRSLLKKLEAGITGKAKSERNKSEMLKKELQVKIILAEIAEKQKTESESETEKATRAGVHAGTVAEANKRNISADSGRRSGETPKKLSEAERVKRKKQAAIEFQSSSPEEQKTIKEKKRDVDWQERVVPIEVTKSGKESLDRQSVISETLKFYDSEDVKDFNKYQAEPKYLMPLPLINKLKQIVTADERGYYSKQGDKKINEVLIGITPLYEQIVRLSESKGVQMNEQLIIKAFTEGLNITKNIGKRSTWDFVKEKKGREIGSSDVGYYDVSAATMEEFFSNRKNIVGEARLPYILSYAAGELVNNAPAHVVLDLRNLISEAIPVEHNSGEKSPLGFGYSIKNNTFNLEGSSTYDKGVVEAFTKANEITLNVFDTLKEKRRFDMESKFASGMGSGRPDFSRQTPQLVVRK